MPHKPHARLRPCRFIQLVSHHELPVHGKPLEVVRWWKVATLEEKGALKAVEFPELPGLWWHLLQVYPIVDKQELGNKQGARSDRLAQLRGERLTAKLARRAARQAAQQAARTLTRGTRRGGARVAEDVEEEKERAEEKKDPLPSTPVGRA